MFNKSQLYSSKFYDFFKQNFADDIKFIEELRKQHIKKVIKTTILFGALLSIAIIVMIYNVNAGKILACCFIMIVMLIYGYIFDDYAKRTKPLILDKLFSFIGDFKQVDKEKYDAQDRTYIKSLELFDDYNIYKCDDRLKGTYKNFPIDIMELCIQKETGYGRHKQTKTIFNGIFIKIPCIKKFKRRTVIKKNKTLLEKNIEFGKKKVTLEDPEFEKIYEVYSADQIEARYLLTTAFMDRMVQLKKENKEIVLSFERGNINIGLTTHHNWFEIPIFTSATDIKNYRNILIELMTILSIIDSLKLDQNIGM